MQPLLSIIVPIYNKQEYLKECIESVIEQTYRPVELILIDDCSKDSSREIVNKYVEKFFWVKGIFLDKNVGVSCARNIGANVANGDYITFLDADDFYYNPMKLQNEMNILLNERGCKGNVVAFSKLIAVDVKKNILWEYKTKAVFTGKKLKTAILSNAKVQIPRDYCFEKKVFIEAGRYDGNMSLYEDYELLLRMSSICTFLCTNQIGTAYRLTEKGLSSVDSRRHKQVLNSLRKKYCKDYAFGEQIYIYLNVIKGYIIQFIKKIIKIILKRI